jgi:hypothetical protein
MSLSNEPHKSIFLTWQLSYTRSRSFRSTYEEGGSVGRIITRCGKATAICTSRSNLAATRTETHSGPLPQSVLVSALHPGLLL